MTLPFELQAKIDEWRRKSNAGTITIEEQREAVALLRGVRRQAAEAASTPKRSPTKSPPRSADDMLKDLL